MAVAVHKLTGGDIPASFRASSVVAVWLVVVNGEAYRFCATEAEAHALAESLREQEYQHALLLAEEPDEESDALDYSGPRMG